MRFDALTLWGMGTGVQMAGFIFVSGTGGMELGNSWASQGVSFLFLFCFFVFFYFVGFQTGWMGSQHKMVK